MSKQISEVHYSGSNLKAYDHDGNEVISQTGVTAEDLPEYIGKEASEKLLAQPVNGTLRSLRGQELEVGGEGMKGYYDQIVPQTMNDIMKQIGAKERVKPIYMDKELASPSASTNYEVVDNTGQLWNTLRHPEDAQKYIDQQMSNPHFLQKGLELSFNPIEPKYKYINPQLGIEITPELRQLIQDEGLPHYHDGGNVSKKVNLEDEFKIAQLRKNYG